MATPALSLDLSKRLANSEIFLDYERAFSEATGLPLAFQPLHRRTPALRSSKWMNGFCRKVSESSAACLLCLEAQEKLCQADGETHTFACGAGLTESAVPVRAGENVIGYLQTGQVMLKAPKRANFLRLIEWLRRQDKTGDWASLEKAYLETPVMNRQQYEAIVRLLEVFAKHLSLAAEQIATHQEHSEPAMVARAREFIEQHQGDDLNLSDVARAVHTSTFHFCKTFKKATGFTFTQYVGLVRTAKAKQLLANPQMRISEVAFEVGFQSLTHFNRVFKKITGQSPTAYREQVIAV